MARLILTLNNNVLSSHKVAPGQNIAIGRHKNNHVVLDNLAVSSRHAKIVFEDDKLTITDLDSRNGTFVNNAKVTESHLAHQDWVTVGKYIIIVDLHESLSLESGADKLMSKQADDIGDQTMLMDYQDSQQQWVGFDYLSFRKPVREDLELSDKPISIGKNTDADIKISGFWSFLAGAPSAIIRKEHQSYALIYVKGQLKPKVNGLKINASTTLNHQDIISLGPFELEIRCVRRPSN